MNNIFVTGLPGSGKSTLVRDVVESCGKKTTGLLTPEIRCHGERVGFRLRDIHSGEEGVLAHVDIRSGPRVGRYGIDLAELDRFVEMSLLNIPEDTELVVVDEIGKMEMFSQQFVDAVDGLLHGELQVLAVLHRSLRDEYSHLGKIYVLEDDHRSVMSEVLDSIV